MMITVLGDPQQHHTYAAVVIDHLIKDADRKLYQPLGEKPGQVVAALRTSYPYS